MNTIMIAPDDPASAEAQTLIALLDDYHMKLYPAESNHLLPVASLRQPNVVFLTARVDGRVAGCGAFVNQDGAYAEIKRMFVLPEFRGLGLGRRLLAELETRIRQAGLGIVRLETGVRQPEALTLYERSGYEGRGPFGAYVEDPLSVFMEKQLD